MRTIGSNRCAPCLCAAVAMLAGCGDITPVSPTAAKQTQVRPAYGVIYSFLGRTRDDGAQPLSKLSDIGGMLYGTTYAGGKSDYGSTFALTTGGKRIAYRSLDMASGGQPEAGFADVNGTLYGTTSAGGDHHQGTVFSILSASGPPTALYSFKGGSDGGTSTSDLSYVNARGTFYGTTEFGGKHNDGTVFEITPDGKETVLHSFAGGPKDGANPLAALSYEGGMLYGTTEYGGLYHLGTVYSITLSGSESVIYSFGKSSGDGEYPRSGLLPWKNMLYGTTHDGGQHRVGTVFKMSLSGTETVLYSFDGVHGTYPDASITEINGTLYGTTTSGGTNHGGTVFKMSASGENETVLHDFPSYPGDGWGPARKPTLLNGMLYGTTRFGGTGKCSGHANQGCGTVYAVSP